jgi:hypothetical protein
MIIAGPFTVTAGLHFGRKHTFVTHADTGKQWVSKSPAGEKRDLEVTADFIKTQTIIFDPDSRIRSCDTRFWMLCCRFRKWCARGDACRRCEIRNRSRSEFDSLVFIGD